MSSIDVVVPCYRYGRFLRECVESVLKQDIGNVRVLILDDDSPDETPEVGAVLAREDSRVTYRRHTANRGHIKTYNEGIDWAAAEYMLLLSADDFLLPGALKRTTDLMDADPGIGLTFGDALEMRDDGTTRPMIVDLNSGTASSIVMSGSEFIGHCIRLGARNIVPTPTAVVKTSLLKRLGGYHVDLPHSGDLDMWLRLAAHSSVGFIRAEQAAYRRHGTNMSNGFVRDNILRDLDQRKRAFDRFLETCHGKMPDAGALHAQLIASLGCDALQLASSALNDDKADLSRAICDFAMSVSPRARRSFGWTKLVLKRRLGHRLSTALLPVIAMLRRATVRSRN